MPHIHNRYTNGVAFTASNCPGFSDVRPANETQLAAHAAAMNKRARELQIKARYEVHAD